MSAMEAYSVAVRVSLINQVSRGLLLMAGQFKMADAQAALFQKRLDGIKRGLAFGAVQTAAGLGIIAAFKPALEQARQFQQEVTKFSMFGMGDQANSQAVKFAKSMNVAGSSYVQNMRLMSEAQGIFRESGKRTLAEQLQGAKIAAPILAKLAFIESGLSPEMREQSHSQDLAMLRFIEARGGANDPRTFAAIADWGFKLSKSSGGVVNWDALRQLTATSGAAGYNLTENAISALEPVIADMGGGRTGSGMRVAFQRLLGTQRGLPVQAVQEFLSLGLWDPSKVELKAGGGIRRFTGAPGDVMRDRTKFATDPVDYYVHDFLPAIAKKYGQGILGDTAEARVQRAAEISMVFGPGTASAVFSQIDKLLPAIQRSLGAQQRQQGIDTSYAAVGKTLGGKQIDFQARWNNLMEQAGEVVLPIAVRGLEALLPLLTRFSNFATAHPRMFGALIDSILGLGVALTASGVIIILGSLGSLFRLVGAVASSEAIFNIGLFASKIPLIGGALGDASVALATLSAPAWGTIAVAGGVILAAGIGLIQFAKTWDSKKSLSQNIKAETKTPLARGLATSVFGFDGPQVVQYWGHIGHQFIIGFRQAFAPLTSVFVGQIKGIAANIQGVFTNLQTWILNKLAAIAKLLHLPPPAGAPGAKPPAKKPAAHAAGHGWTLMGPKDWGHWFGEAAANQIRGPLGIVAAGAAALHVSTAQAKTATDGIIGQHHRVAGADNELVTAVQAAARSIMAAAGAKPVLPPPNGGHTTQVTVPVHLDGHQIAKVVSKHQARALGGVNAGIPRHDPSVTPAAPGAGYTR